MKTVPMRREDEAAIRQLVQDMQDAQNAKNGGLFASAFAPEHAAYFGRLAHDGFDVYVYDEVGSGRSSRLEDPRGYTLARDAADLEAIRKKIGVERMVLIGHSHGAAIAAAYAAEHPEHVVKMVLSSPEDPSPSAGGASMTFRLTN